MVVYQQTFLNRHFLRISHALLNLLVKKFSKFLEQLETWDFGILFHKEFCLLLFCFKDSEIIFEIASIFHKLTEEMLHYVDDTDCCNLVGWQLDQMVS